MPIYYTEEPFGEFRTENDELALRVSDTNIIYRESNTTDGKSFVFLREEPADE